MNLFVFELRKIVRQKSIWVLFAICLILNLLFLNVTEQNRHNYTPKMYRELEKDLAGKTEEEAFRWLNEQKQELETRIIYDVEHSDESNICGLYTGDEWTELELFSDMATEREKILHYSEYLDGIKRDADMMLEVSIFQNSSNFSVRNIRKTADDFSKMDVVKPYFDTTRGVTMATGFLPTDFLAVFLLFAACIFLVLYEKQQGLFELISHTAKGRRELLFAKLAVLMIGAVFIFAGLYAGNMISAGYLYGFGDLSRPVQSVDAYQSSVLPVSVGQYFCAFAMVKVLIYIVIGLIFFLLCLWLRQLSAIFLAVLGILAGNTACYFLISDNVAAYSIKYLNLFYFLRTDRLLMYYKNVNLFGEPVEILWISLLLSGALVAIFIMMSMKAIHHTRIFRKGRSAKKTVLSSDRKIRGGCSLSGFEYQKIMMKTGAVFLLILFFAVQCVRICQYSYLTDADAVYYQTYMQYLQGPVTEKTEKYVKEEHERYEWILNQDQTLLQGDKLNQLQQDLLPYRAWQKVEEEYERIRAAESLNEQISLVYDEGYKRLMGDEPQMDLTEVCMMAVLFCLCFSSVFSGDSSIGMDHLLRTTAGGRRDTLRAKQKVTFFGAVVIYVLVYGMDFLKIYIRIGMAEWNTSIRSLQMFSDAVISVKIWQYILLLYLLRFFGMIVMLYVIWALSLWCKDSFRTVLFHLIVFLLPAVCGMIGITQIEKITLIPLLCGNMLLNSLILDGNIINAMIYPVCAFFAIVLLKKAIILKNLE